MLNLSPIDSFPSGHLSPPFTFGSITAEDTKLFIALSTSVSRFFSILLVHNISLRSRSLKRQDMSSTKCRTWFSSTLWIERLPSSCTVHLQEIVESLRCLSNTLTW
uniref:Uncharacterized protein n=1 Tax=Arundo donax TaxID=35708 RepID=A0A0A9DPV0_ARUDO